MRDDCVACGSMTELVVLLDSQGREIGTMPKADVHHSNTPLHKAFSIFLFDRAGRMLAQQRALSKKTWPGIWSNTCCGHPLPGESTLNAANRRLREELGLKGVQLHLALPRFRYQAVCDGILENEVCPVFVGLCPSELNFTPNPSEVADTEWVSWDDFCKSSHLQAQHEYSHFSPWSLMEARLLRQSSVLKALSTNFERIALTTYAF